MITTKTADSKGLVMTSKNGQSIESSPFIYRQCMRSYASGYTSVIETFCEACRKTAHIWRRYHRFPQQMLDLGSTSDWSCSVGNLIKPIRSTTQIWVVTHQYGISALVFRRHLAGKPVVASPNVGCFFRQLFG